MINKTIEEKKKVFFDIQEHPDKYSDQQIEEILADEELKATIHDAARIKRAIKKLNPQKVNVDDAWQQFSKTHIRHQHNWMKIAASIIGIVFLSGVALAAVIQLGILHTSPSHKATIKTSITKQVNSQNYAKTEKEIKKDSVDMKPIVFENAKLKDILDQMATFYNVKVVYQNEDTGKIRLFFNWDKKQSLDYYLKILNGFEHINIIYSDNTITVE